MYNSKFDDKRIQRITNVGGGNISITVPSTQKKGANMVLTKEQNNDQKLLQHIFFTIR